MPSAKQCTILLRQFAHGVRWPGALHLLSEMQRHGPQPNLITYNATLNVLAKARRWQEALHILQQCGEAQSVLADTQTYNTTLESLRNNPAMTENLLAQMRRSRIPPSVVTLGILVASTCTWQKAIELVAEGQEHSIVPNTIVYNALITALEKGSQWPTCLDLLQRLDTNATVVSFNACISACARDQQSRQAQQLFDRLCSQRLAPTTVTYNALINAHVRYSHVDSIHNFIHQMQERSLQADTITLNGLLAAYEKRFKWREALHVAFTSGVQRDVVSYNALISACEKGQQWQLGLSLFTLMNCQEQLQPNVITYSAAISACEQVQQWTVVLHLLLEMQQKTVRPNVITYSAAASAYEKGQRWVEVLELLQQMKSDEVQPNVISFTAAVRACEASQRWEKSLKLIEDMVQTSVAPDVITSKIASMALTKSQQPRSKAQSLLVLHTLRGSGGSSSMEEAKVSRKLLQPMVQVFHGMGTPQMARLHDWGLAWRENVCDLGSHFTKDAAEHLLLPTWQGAVGISSQPVLQKLMHALPSMEPVAQEQSLVLVARSVSPLMKQTSFC
eukprot:symbB.v1.2.023928.t1/scaffold2229.1/size85226/2